MHIIKVSVYKQSSQTFWKKIYLQFKGAINSKLIPGPEIHDFSFINKLLATELDLKNNQATSVLYKYEQHIFCYFPALYY